MKLWGLALVPQTSNTCYCNWMSRDLTRIHAKSLWKIPGKALCTRAKVKRGNAGTENICSEIKKIDVCCSQ